MTNPTYFTVIGDYKSIVADTTNDSDANPDLSVLTATVTFTPMINNGDVILATQATPRPTGFVLAPITGFIDTDGKLKMRAAANGDYDYTPIRLLANTSLLNLSSPLIYKVSFSSVTYDNRPGTINSFFIEASTTDEVVDLISVAQVPGQNAVGITHLAPGAVRLDGTDIIFSFGSTDIPDPVSLEGLRGETGATGAAATISVGTVSTGNAGSSATVTNAGTSSAAVLNFTIPKGDTGSTGSTGAAATISVGTVTTGNAGSSASVTNVGTSGAATFDFTIPKGDKGDTGNTGSTGSTGSAATISVGTVTTGNAGSSASVTNVGTSGAATFDFTIPKGDTGATGATGSTGAAATIALGTVTTGAAGSSASATNTGNSGAAVFNFTIPRGDPGEVTFTGTQTLTNKTISGASNTITSLNPNTALSAATSTATAAGTTTLTVSSTQNQTFTGSTTQTVVLPSASVTAGSSWSVRNLSTGLVTVNAPQPGVVLPASVLAVTPWGIAVNAAGTYGYVANYTPCTVSVFDTATNTVTATVGVGSGPTGVAVNPTGTRVYATNFNGGTVSVIDTSNNTVTATVTVGSQPNGLAVNPAGTYVYVPNYGAGTVSVIDTSTNTVTATVTVGSGPYGATFNAAGTKAYVTNYGAGTVSVIDTSTNTVTATINVGTNPRIPVVAGSYVYVSNYSSSTVSVIDTATNTVTATITTGTNPWGMAANPAGTKAYVTNYGAGTVSVIDTSTNTVTATITVSLATLNGRGIAINPAGTKAYVTNYTSGGVSIIDLAGTLVTQIPSGQVTTFTAVSATPTTASTWDTNKKVILPASATPNAARLVVKTATGGSGTENGANTWAKLVTINPAINDSGHVLLGITTGGSFQPQSAILSVYAYAMQPSPNLPTVAVQIIGMPNGGYAFYQDGFKLVNNGYGQPVELWIKKSDQYTFFSVTEISQSFQAGTTITYNDGAAWQSAEPTGSAVNVRSTGVTIGGIPVVTTTGTQALANKTISGASNTITNLPASALVASTSAAVGFGSIELGHATDTTLSRSAAGKLAVEGVDVLLNGGALGTPSSGTLTNATGLPVAGITASTATALGVGSLELGHATDTTLSRSAAGVLAVEGVNLVDVSSAATLTNKTLSSPTINTPKIDTIKDTNGANALLFSATASAVNYFQITNTASGGGGVNLSAVGSDTNLSLQLQPKGTGGIQIWSGLTANQPRIVANGPDTNHDILLQPKGTGLVYAGGVQVDTISGVATLTNKTLTAPTLNNPTITNYTESVVAIGTVTTANTIALTNGTVQTATLTASTACTFTMPTAVAGKSFVLMLKQAASTGNGTATFTGVKWAGGTAPTITATAGKMDILSFASPDGTNWYGSSSQNYTA